MDKKEKTRGKKGIRSSESRAHQRPQPQRALQPIVAIGASAGGLEALQQFFKKMPPDSGIGFVVITHIKPGRESLLPELLSNVTAMPVCACEDQMAVRPNHVLVAKDALLRIDCGVLKHVQDDGSIEASYHPIDHFFRGLAEDQREHAIGIVLSGSGNDGTLGLKAIKAAGGMVMVQDPDTAKYPAMPASARAAGLADFVLPPDELPAALIGYCRGPYLDLVGREAVPQFPDDTIHAILVRLRAHTGRDFTYYKASTMARRVARRMSVHRIEEIDEYLRYLTTNPHELDLLLQELLISVTSFFRDPEAFDALAGAVMPHLLEECRDDHAVRVWIPGCATGEEAYSIAILVDEQIRKRGRPHDVQIFATDLDRRAIAAARTGLYPEGIRVELTPQRMQRYFFLEGETYRINKNIRDMVVFAVQDVGADPPFTRMDLVVCRNLLIYLNRKAQMRLVPLFHYALRPGGFLFLGSSETITGSEDLFEMVDGKHKILRRKEVARQVYPAFGAGGSLPQDGAEFPTKEAVPEPANSRHFARTVERLLLSQYAPCSVIVDQRDTMVYVHGRSGMFFEPEQGPPRNSVVEMAREGLRLALLQSLRFARQEDKEAVQRGVPVRTNGDYLRVDVKVRPLKAPESLRGLLLLTIEPAGEDGAPKPPVETAELPPGAERDELERELQSMRENLQISIEELETSNEELKSTIEELQSTNEELQSSNEELETSKEEMQSLNEELSTVNGELQNNVEALSRSNDDMNNLLNSMQVAAIFLNSDLRVIRYTKKAQDVFRLIDSDIGRPLADLACSLDYSGVIDDCRRTLETLVPVEKEVCDDIGRSFLVRLLPYRTADNIVDGIVLTIVEIFRTRGAEPQAGAGESLAAFIQTARHPMLVLDEDFRVVKANSAFYREVDSHPQDTEDRIIFDLDDRNWDIPELRRLLEKILPDRTAVTDFRFERALSGGGRRVFLLNARRAQVGAPVRSMILLAFEDVTETEA